MAGRRAGVAYLHPAQKLNWREVSQEPAGKTFTGSSGVGINSFVAFEPNPRAPFGWGEVNDDVKLNSRKDWIVGLLEPFSRTREAEAEWKAATCALLGESLILHFNFRNGEYQVRGNSVPFPTKADVKRAGGGASEDIQLVLLCPERGINGPPNWLVTSEELIREKRFDEVFQSGQLIPDCRGSSATKRWPYTVAAVTFTETPTADSSSKHKFHILDILLDGTKLPVLNGAEQIAESLYQVLHGFLALVVKKTSQPSGEGGVSDSSGEGEQERPVQEASGAKRVHVILPEFVLSESNTLPGPWTEAMKAAVESLGFGKEKSGGWGHSLKACSKCGAWDRKSHLCSACQRVRYCSQACQKAAWGEGHKQECKVFRAAKESSKVS